MATNSHRAIQSRILPILKRAGVKKAALFGSYARGAAKPGSDIDLLIAFAGEKGLLGFVKLKLELERKLGRKVDLITYKSLHPLLRDPILGSIHVIYEERT